MVSTYCDNKTHGRMLRNCRVNLEKYAAEAYVIADSPKLGNRVSEVNLQIDRIAYAEPTIPALLGLGSPTGRGGFSHK